MEKHVLEGTVKIMWQTSDCVCCPGDRHAYCRYIDLDDWDGPEHDKQSIISFIHEKVTDNLDNEGKRVRITVEVLDDA